MMKVGIKIIKKQRVRYLLNIIVRMANVHDREEALSELFEREDQNKLYE